MRNGERLGKRICMLVEWLPPLFSGAARQALQLAPHLKTQGLEVFFVGSLIAPQSAPFEILNDLPVYRVPFSTGNKLQRLLGLFRLCTLLAHHRRAWDILHLHGAYHLTLAAACFARIILGKYVVIKMTSINFDTPGAIANRDYGRLSSWLYKQANAFVCMTTAQYNDAVTHGIPMWKLHQIPNGVDTLRFCPASTATRCQNLERLGLSSEGRYAVFIGTIEANKGVELLLDIAIAVCAVRPDFKFLLVGPNGSAANEHHVNRKFVTLIRERIRTAGLTANFLLLGQKPNPEDFLRAATCFLSVSRSEGFGTVLIEAMASGLPCIALNIPGVTSDIITPNCDGIILQSEDSWEFAQAILRLLNNPVEAHQLGQAARQKVLERFDIRTIANRYVHLYETLPLQPVEAHHSPDCNPRH